MKLTLYHYSESEFSEFSLKHASKTAIYGPGIYLSETDKLSGWGKTRSKAGYLYTVSFSGEVIDISKPAPDSAYDRIESVIGREIPPEQRDGALPLMSLIRASGSVTEGIRDAGYDAVAHRAPGGPGIRGEIHYAVVNVKSLKIIKVDETMMESVGITDEIDLILEGGRDMFYCLDIATGRIHSKHKTERAAISQTLKNDKANATLADEDKLLPSYRTVVKLYRGNLPLWSVFPEPI